MDSEEEEEGGGGGGAEHPAALHPQSAARAAESRPTRGHHRGA